MRTVDRIAVHAPVEDVFRIAAEVERWPDFLSHYRWVRVRERSAGRCTGLSAVRFSVAGSPVKSTLRNVDRVLPDPRVHRVDDRDLPPAVLTIRRHARAWGCDDLLFDADADRVGDLPTWDW